MTGEKDPRDVMQAEHDAGLSEHPAFRAPAEMPGVEEIGQALAIFLANNRQPCMSGDPRDRLSPLRRRDLDDATSAILNLFAPILETLERANAELVAVVNDRRFVRCGGECYSDDPDPNCALEGEFRRSIEALEARALAAEAALAAERGRCAKIAESAKSYDDNLQRSAGCATTGQRIAAAIRAQASNEPGA